MGAFNGGEFVAPDMSVVRTLDVEPDLTGPIIDSMRSHGLFVWAYSGKQWYVTDLGGPRRGKGGRHGSLPTRGCRFAERCWDRS